MNDSGMSPRKQRGFGRYLVSALTAQGRQTVASCVERRPELPARTWRVSFRRALRQGSFGPLIAALRGPDPDLSAETVCLGFRVCRVHEQRT